MTFSFLWFAVGLVAGLEVACLIWWWSLRRENRKAAYRSFPPIDVDPGYLERRERILASRRADQ